MAETPIDPRIDKALKKCNPQQAIYALAEVENEVIDQINTTETTLNTRMDGIETDMTNLETNVDTRLTTTEANVAQAVTTANGAKSDAQSAISTANGAAAGVAALETKVDQVETTANTAFDTIANTADASTVNVNMTRINNQTQSTALPVVSAAHAGFLNSADYIKFTEYNNRLTSLEGESITYVITLATATPTQSEITEAYRTAYPNAPYPPLDGTIAMAPNQNLSYRWVVNSNQWIKISAEPIGLFTLDKEGLIKGSETAGEVYPNADGTGAVNGWDALNTRVTNAESGITGNTTLANNKAGQIAFTNTANTVTAQLKKSDGTQISAANIPLASTSGAGAMSAEQVSTLNALSTGGKPSIQYSSNSSLAIKNRNGTNIASISINNNGSSNETAYAYFYNYTGSNAIMNWQVTFSPGYETTGSSSTKINSVRIANRTGNVANNSSLNTTYRGFNNQVEAIGFLQNSQYTILVFAKVGYLAPGALNASDREYTACAFAVVWE